MAETMKAVVLHEYSLDLSGVRVEDRPVPRPGRGEVLVKVAATPINPSDVLFLQGQYGFRKPTPVIAGFEASGTVVAAGGGLIARSRVGKRVTCAVQNVGDGVWAEYVKVPATMCIPTAPALSDEQAATFVVNPFTAWALIDIARKRREKAVLHSAAGSALGRMMWRLGQSQGVEVIGVVRRAAQAEELRKAGMRHVLDSEAPDFEPAMAALCKEYNVHTAFDAVGGEMTGKMLAALRKGGTVTVYGLLSGESPRAGALDLVFRGKSVDGFWLSDWLAQRGIIGILTMSRRMTRLIQGELGTEIRARYSFAQAVEALSAYTSQMSGGKILLTP